MSFKCSAWVAASSCALEGTFGLEHPERTHAEVEALVERDGRAQALRGLAEERRSFVVCDVTFGTR